MVTELVNHNLLGDEIGMRDHGQLWLSRCPTCGQQQGRSLRVDSCKYCGPFLDDGQEGRARGACRVIPRIKVNDVELVETSHRSCFSGRESGVCEDPRRSRVLESIGSFAGAIAGGHGHSHGTSRDDAEHDGNLIDVVATENADSIALLDAFLTQTTGDITNHSMSLVP